MLNIFGLALAFIGSFISLVTVMTSKYEKEGITYEELENLGDEFSKQRTASTIGFGFMMIGFLFQIIAAYQNL
ncbi:hypothetical protein [Metasolibacillus meyeri]|uniref:hypothetical protein n=1 Tax=Metasolibacillus meyeri TaxID=1071052 RepID=UPI000D2F6434|nr:hypothetical protein [Metasolibacillus meyeri]